MRIAVIGSGISGLSAAWLLQRQHEVTIYEAGPRLGGHVNTLSVQRPDRTWNVDTGFIVYNEKTYPLFTRLMSELSVATQASTMSFSVRNDRDNLEYNGHSTAQLIAQKRNLLRPRFYKMVRDILRFNDHAVELVQDTDLTLRELIQRGGYGPWFVENYILPMGAAVWSTSLSQMLDFPARFFVQFFDNHGFLQVNDRPEWRVISGGSKSYVDVLASRLSSPIKLSSPVQSVRRTEDGVTLTVHGETQVYDHVVMAVHADQALRMLADPSTEEQAVLGAIPYSKNTTWLHTDASLLPRRRKVWAAWNYHMDQRQADAPTVTYNMNMLQGFDRSEQFLVSLNATDAIDRQQLIEAIEYEHPLFTNPGMIAQGRHADINNQRRTSFCGAYWRNGFHEDGLWSGVRVASALGVEWA